MKPAWVVALAALLVAGCSSHSTRRDSAGKVADDIHAPQSQRYQQQHDGGPTVADVKRIDEMPLPVPKAEPRSRYGNKSPYTVRGHSYRVLPTARGYHARGIASWYGAKFHGHLTSSLEPYDMYRFTAAHKTLPLPTWARVTNLENGKSVIVRINDRGPFHANRLIDLSYAAAVRIGIWRKGTGLVEVDAIDPEDTGNLPPPPVVDAAAGKPRLYLQVGAFANAANASRLAARLRALAIGTVSVVPAEVGGRRLERVRIGPVANVEAADRLSRQIQQQGLPEPQAVVE